MGVVRSTYYSVWLKDLEEEACTLQLENGPVYGVSIDLSGSSDQSSAVRIMKENSLLAPATQRTGRSPTKSIVSNDNRISQLEERTLRMGSTMNEISIQYQPISHHAIKLDLSQEEVIVHLVDTSKFLMPDINKRKSMTNNALCRGCCDPTWLSGTPARVRKQLK